MSEKKFVYENLTFKKDDHIKFGENLFAENPDLQRKKDKVIILGYSPYSLESVPWENEDFEFWGMNDLYLQIPKADRWFEIHVKEYSESTPRNKQHINWLRNTKVPIMMTKKFEDIKNSVKYPLYEALTMFPYGDYLTNSCSFMLALAIMMGFKEIRIHGIDMASDNLLDCEYGFQRPSCEYWLGIAAGLGIQIVLPPKADMLKKPYLYGYEEDSEKRIKIEARRRDFQQRMANAEQEKRNAVQKMYHAIVKSGHEDLINESINFIAQINQLDIMAAKFAGATENSEYVVRVWSNNSELEKYSKDENAVPKFDGQIKEQVQDIVAPIIPINI
jgi:hypothetical protein